MARLISGIQPSGVPTLGNYLGAMRNWVRLQDAHECLFCIVDLHAITTFQDPAGLRAATRQMAASAIACGIDPVRHILFHQSGVAAHAQLAWIFNCVARLGWLNRMTQFKDKSGANRENASAGLYVYPNLMAADILAYRGTLVPVGDDQRQHIELANDIGQKFNHDYGQDYARAHGQGFFPMVEALIEGPAARVMSLRDGTRKMSKSDPSDMARINMTDDADTIALKMRRAVSDPAPLPYATDELADRPQARNLVGIYAALADTDAQAVLNQFGGQGFGTFKPMLAALMISVIGPIRAETLRLLEDPDALDGGLRAGAARAAAIADPIVAEASRLVGFLG